MRNETASWTSLHHRVIMIHELSNPTTCCLHVPFLPASQISLIPSGKGGYYNAFPHLLLYTQTHPAFDLTSMAQFYLFNPTRKFGLFSRFLFRRSKRLLRSADTSVPLTIAQRRDNVNLSRTLAAAVTLDGSLSHDPDFYLRDPDGGFLVFLVENTLFKVTLLSPI